MKKLILVLIILVVLSLLVCFVSNFLVKIDSDFGSLDNDNDGYIFKVEVDDDVIWEYFLNIDINMDE